MASWTDLSNRRFSRLLALSFVKGTREFRGYWKCLCDCGNICCIQTSQLLNGDTQSCGCLKKQRASEVHKSHGKSHTKTYESWHNMRQRCDNSNKNGYENYGGRGITYDPRWSLFENFLEDMGEKPENLELDRKNPNLNYNKENCHWVDSSYQSFNKRLNNGKTKGLSELPNGNWRAVIYKDKKKYELGIFKYYEEAQKARREAEIKYYGKELT